MTRPGAAEIPEALERAVRELVAAAAANHADGEGGMTTLRSTQCPVLEHEKIALTRRLQELGVGYEVGMLRGGGGVYVSVVNDRRAQEALRRNWSAVTRGPVERSGRHE